MQALTIVGRVLATILCGPMLLIGCIWILQGLNVLPGSFMTGDIKWAVFGLILALAGAALVYWLNRRPRAKAL
jgi:hypothetical protein